MKKNNVQPITINNWRETPVFSGQLATTEDVDNNRAIFSTIEAGGEIFEINLPFCATYKDGPTGKKSSVIAVQAEKAHDKVIVGVIEVSGETMVCTLPELEIINDPDEAFFTVTNSKPWWKLW